jgi:hypothetical protein
MSGFFSVYQQLEGDQDPLWFPATPEEIARIEAIRREKEAACKSELFSSLPKAFWGFLDPNKGLGGIPDPKYTAILEKRSPGQNDLTSLSTC